MDDTPNLSLPYIMAAQAQKHVTHNEAIRVLDAIVQLAVLDQDLASPPGSSAEGDRYIVGAAATGDWASHDGEIAAFQDGAWIFYAPGEGWVAWVADEDRLYAWDGAAWVAASASVNPTPLVGVNATADATNRLSVNSPATLLNHEGAGHQLKLNKNAAADTASLLYQSGFSGRAEMGLAGDDDFHVKVSPDGAAWSEAMVIDKDTGFLGVGTNAPQARLHIDGSVIVAGSDGIDCNPSSDTNVDLITVGVAGSPRLIWNEAENGFSVLDAALLIDGCPDFQGFAIFGVGTIRNGFAPGGGGGVVFDNAAASGFYWRQGAVDKVVFPGTGGLAVGTAVLATDASDGFLYVPTCAGTPTGTPTPQAGTVPIVVDSSNHKLYFYSGGVWRDAGP